MPSSSDRSKILQHDEIVFKCNAQWSVCDRNTQHEIPTGQTLLRCHFQGQFCHFRFHVATALEIYSNISSLWSPGKYLSAKAECEHSIPVSSPWRSAVASPTLSCCWCAIHHCGCVDPDDCMWSCHPWSPLTDLALVIGGMQLMPKNHISCGSYAWSNWTCAPQTCQVHCMSEYDTNNTNTVIGRWTSHVMEAYTMTRKCQADHKNAQALPSLTWQFVSTATVTVVTTRETGTV